MATAALLDRVDKLRRTGSGRWLARCPAHGDRSPSLSIRELDDGRVLVHCFAGCSAQEIVAAAGLELDALFPERSIEHGKRERQPFSARDALVVLGFEALFVAVAACNAAGGYTLTDEDRQRLLLASERIQKVIQACSLNGN